MPIGFAANNLSPANQIFGRFSIAPSSASLGHIHHAAIATATTAVARPPRPCILFNHVEHVEVLHVSTRSTRPIIPEETSTSMPVREYVIASITQSATPTSRPAQCHLPRHPQQNGNNAQIAAAAWLGFAKPKPCRTTSPTTKSTMHLPSAALDGLQQPFSYKHSLRTSLAGNLQSSHFRQVLCSIPIDLKTPNYPRH